MVRFFFRDRKRKFIKKDKFNLKKLFFLIFFLLLAISFYFLFISDFLNVEDIEIETDKLICAENQELSDSLDIIGKNILLLQAKKIIETLQQKYLCVKSVNIQKKLPKKVKVSLLGRKPAAILILEEAQATSAAEFVLDEASPSAATFSAGVPKLILVVDEEGLIFSDNFEGIDVPKLHFENEELFLGKKISSGIIKNSIDIFNATETFGINIKEAKIYSQKYLYINSNPFLVFSFERPIDLQLASLQLILSKSKMNEENMEFVDLRFEKPVVKYTPKKK